MNITVVGSGTWGTALALVLQTNGHSVTLWGFDPQQIATMEDTRENPLLPGVPLPKELQLSTQLSTVANCGAIVLAVPSFAVRETAQKLKPHLSPGTVIVTVSKGIEKDSFLRLSQVVESEIPGCPVVVLSGPSHAEEVGKGVPTGLVAAADDPLHSQLVQDLFMNPRFRVYTSEDKIGTELCGALKNVIAVCAGCCDGLGHGDNTKAMLMTRGLAEMARLGVALGAQKETFNGLAGVGDLIVTCTSMHSRNRRFGIMLGQGKTPEEAISQAGGVVEGYYAVTTACALAKSVSIEMPIAQSIYHILFQGGKVAEVTDQLMQRAKRSEAEDIWKA